MKRLAKAVQAVFVAIMFAMPVLAIMEDNGGGGSSTITSGTTAVSGGTDGGVLVNIGGTVIASSTATISGGVFTTGASGFLTSGSLQAAAITSTSSGYFTTTIGGGQLNVTNGVTGSSVSVTGNAYAGGTITSTGLLTASTNAVVGGSLTVTGGIASNGSGALTAVSGTDSAVIGTSGNASIFRVNTATISVGGVPVEGAGGWTDDSGHTWTALSASQFTINADMSGVLTSGTKVKFTNNGGTYYSYISTMAYGVSNAVSTATVLVNLNYVMAAGAITAPYYSNASTPAGFRTVFQTTTTIGGFSANPTPSYLNVSMVGKRVFLSYYPTASGTSNATTYTMTAPLTSANVTAAAAGFTPWSGHLQGLNGGAALANGGSVGIAANSATITLGVTDAGSAWSNTSTKAAQFELFYDID